MQRLISILKNGCCIFVGAGIPKLIGFPTWQEMIAEILNYTWSIKDSFVHQQFTLSEKQELESMMLKERYIHVLSFCKDLFKKNNVLDMYYAKLEELFADEQKYKNLQHEGYSELFKLGKNSFFVQTNVDLSLEVFLKKFKNISVFINTSLPPINNIPSLSVIYLHGNINNKETLIFTIDEYNAFYQKNSNFINFIQGLFNTYDVIFLGYGLNDKEILDNIVKSNSSRSRFLILGKTIRNEARNRILRQYFSNFGIEIIEYNIESGHEKIVDFLRSLNSKLLEPLLVSSPKEEEKSKP